MSNNFNCKALENEMKVYPSMLSANPCCLGDELRELAEADGIHWDVMDGNFVNDITFGAQIIKAHREITSQIFDVHLMVANPENHIENFAKAGADIITIHAEATAHLHAALNFIKSCGCRAGVALTPSTAPDFIQYIMDVVDVILVMTVNPGRAGQSFLYSQLEKIRDVAEMISDDIEICVDGGINSDTAKACEQMGAASCVSGSYIFRSDNYSAAIRELADK